MPRMITNLLKVPPLAIIYNSTAMTIYRTVNRVSNMDQNRPYPNLKKLNSDLCPLSDPNLMKKTEILNQAVSRISSLSKLNYIRF